jgi:hypothetical protein
MDQLPYWLTYYAKLMKIGPTHTHILDTDPLTTPASLVVVIGHNKQASKQSHLTATCLSSPTTYKATTINYKPSHPTMTTITVVH